MINSLHTMSIKFPYKEQSLIIIAVVLLVLFFVFFLMHLLIRKLRQNQVSYRKSAYFALMVALGLTMVGLGAQTLYQNNTWSVQTKVLKPIQSYERQKSNRAASTDTTSRADIAKMVMRQAVSGLEKQGFVSIPSQNILLPIYNDAYSDKGLNAGADYANKSEFDPSGDKKPVMGQGNYGIAAHNFNDGQTGFSSLQQETNHDFPYLNQGQLKGSNWLNGQTVLLANAQGIYDYRITGQTLVAPETVSVLNPTDDTKVTIISCLFPSTNYRIITHATLKRTYTWDNAPQHLAREFNLKVKNTNAHASWWNPGIEEGANGDKGGTK
ncbi:class A sortase [Leuconostoc citreum]|uniref:class A sortase n=1 Tax=Leuconostoc citreum TaxID=33964 RepID=UPI00200AD3A8|nr:class A sortase [Leuconostoc citreum]MCK8605666.1 class A sortase [Leuconostoc citreum]